MDTVISVNCEKHGEFKIKPKTFLKGSGCPLCKKEKDFIKAAIEKHGNKYDYSKVNYVNAKTPVCLVCPKHGDFYIIPNKNTSLSKQGCPRCAESILETGVRVLCENNNIEFNQQKTFPWLGLQRLDRKSVV